METLSRGSQVTIWSRSSDPFAGSLEQETVKVLLRYAAVLLLSYYGTPTSIYCTKYFMANMNRGVSRISVYECSLGTI